MKATSPYSSGKVLRLLAAAAAAYKVRGMCTWLDKH